MPVEKDYYYYLIDKREKAHETDFYNEAKEYFEKKYDNGEWSVKPDIDHDSRKTEQEEIITNLEIKNEALTQVEKTYKISDGRIISSIIIHKVKTHLA